MDQNIDTRLADIMDKVQRSSSCHQKSQIVLLKWFKENKIEFYEGFKEILERLVQQNFQIKNMYIERCVDFCTAVCAAAEWNNSDSGCEFLFEKVLDFLLTMHNLESDSIRFRVCQMINKLLNNLSGRELQGELCDKIEESMLQRIQGESKAEVRFEALSAIHHLQDPANLRCPIVPVLISRMSGDLSGKVRLLCVQKICNRRDVLIAMVLRIRDINSDVRLAAFTRICDMVKYLKISERHSIIRNGFFDNNSQIRHFVSKQLVSSWLSDYGKDYLKLLKALRLDSTEQYTQRTIEVTEKILGGLFSCRPCEEILGVLNVGNKRVLAYEDLNWESAIYWRCLVERFRKSDEYEAHVDSILPDLVVFVKYISGYYKLQLSKAQRDSEFEFVLTQLFIITQGYDVADTASRQALNQLVADVLQNVHLSSKVTTIVIQNLRKSMPKIEDQINFVCEIISNIMYPVNAEENLKEANDLHFKIAQLKVQLNCVKEKRDAAVKEEDYMNAAAYRDECEELKESISQLEATLATPAEPVAKITDADTVLKCLNVARGLLVCPQLSIFNPVLRTLCEDVIVEHIMHANEQVRARALECYALCCILDLKLAEKGINIFTTYMVTCAAEEELYDFESLQVAMSATVDLLVVFGSKLFNPSENEDEVKLITLTQIIQTLVDLMDDENVDIQVCAGQGLCNLILHQRISSASLISRMILRWCNPALDDEYTQRLRQIIGNMLEKYTKLAGSVDLIEKAVLPTIAALVSAPRSSPLSEVDVLDVIKFMLAMCEICEEATNYQSTLAVSICCEIRDNPQADQRLLVTLSKVLLMLDLWSADVQLIKDLQRLCDNIRDVVDDRFVLIHITKFVANLALISEREHNVSIIIEEDDNGNEE